MFNNATALLFLLLYLHLDTVSLYVKVEYKCWKKVQWPKEVWSLPENLNLSSTGVFSFGAPQSAMMADLYLQSAEVDNSM